MKAATPTLASLMNSNLRLVFADLYTITLSGGQVIRLCSHDQPLKLGSTTWARGPQITRDKLKVKVGISVDTLDLVINNSRAGYTINGVPIFKFIAAGGLDGARVLVERGYAADWSTTTLTGKLHKFSGRVSDIKVDRHEATLTVTSDLESLNQMVPRNLYQSPCVNTLYDGACGISRAAKTVSGTVTTVGDTRSFTDSGRSEAQGYFALGVVTMTSGQNSGISRTVRNYDSGWFNLLAPLPFAPALGDTYTVYPGCDKTLATCTGKFVNQARFRGMPFIPVPETVT